MAMNPRQYFWAPRCWLVQQLPPNGPFVLREFRHQAEDLCRCCPAFVTPCPHVNRHELAVELELRPRERRRHA